MPGVYLNVGLVICWRMLVVPFALCVAVTFAHMERACCVQNRVAHHHRRLENLLFMSKNKLLTRVICITPTNGLRDPVLLTCRYMFVLVWAIS